MILNVNGLDLFSNDFVTASTKVMEYMVYKHKLPILALDDGGRYHFARTDECQKALEEMPIGLRILCLFD